jgi:hypothetical protein
MMVSFVQAAKSIIMEKSCQVIQNMTHAQDKEEEEEEGDDDDW